MLWPIWSLTDLHEGHAKDFLSQAINVQNSLPVGFEEPLPVNCTVLYGGHNALFQVQGMCLSLS